MLVGGTVVLNDPYTDQGANNASHMADVMMSKPLLGMIEIVGAATQHPKIADMFIQNLADPIKFWPWIEDAEAARKVIEEQLGKE